MKPWTRRLLNNSANAIIFLNFSLCAVLGGCNFGTVRGADTPERVVEQYILGLEQQKENVILQLIPKEYVAEQAVEDKISQFGGHEVEEYSVVYNEVKPVFLIANIKGMWCSCVSPVYVPSSPRCDRRQWLYGLV
ncbi:hypothetical protein [Coleofasciculus sp. E2-BRE-01]|uniref:hypothetical protein n=1 Tax=Coleofasciculus sp. E2-BRE-01 TaxID=3069524 RepID=UPI0040631EC2